MSGAKVECPTCHKVWLIPQGTPDILCDCHLYCQYGTKPSDCSLTPVSFSGQLAWPRGMHINSADEGDDVLHRTYYCSTHKVYSSKVPTLIEMDWQKWYSQRAPKKFRLNENWGET